MILSPTINLLRFAVSVSDSSRLILLKVRASVYILALRSMVAFESTLEGSAAIGCCTVLLVVIVGVAVCVTVGSAHHQIVTIILFVLLASPDPPCYDSKTNQHDGSSNAANDSSNDLSSVG